MASVNSPVVLYDGVCGLCNGFVRFALARDRRGALMFAPLDSEFGRAVIARHPALRGRDSIVYVDRARGEVVATRSDAVLRIARDFGLGWRVLARVYGLMPRPVRDAMYDFIARRRYAWFGRYDVCPVPAPEHRARFIK